MSLQLLSYTLHISLSIMELQWPEFVNYTYILIARVNFEGPYWKIFKVPFNCTIPYEDV